MKTLTMKKNITNDTLAAIALEDAYALIDKVDTYLSDNEELTDAHSAVNEALVALAEAIDIVEGK